MPTNYRNVPGRGRSAIGRQFQASKRQTMIASANGPVITAAIPMNATAPSITITSSAIRANRGVAPPRPRSADIARISTPTKRRPTANAEISLKVRGCSPPRWAARGCAVVMINQVVELIMTTA